MNTKNVSDFLNTEVKEYAMDVVENRAIPSVMDNLTDNESSDELIQSLFDEHEKNETRKLKNRQYNYNTRSRKTLVEELQKENEELKKKYEKLQLDYFALKNGKEVKVKDESNEIKEQKSHNWWEEI